MRNLETSCPGDSQAGIAKGRARSPNEQLTVRRKSDQIGFSGIQGGGRKTRRGAARCGNKACRQRYRRYASKRGHPRAKAQQVALKAAQDPPWRRQAR